MIGNLLRGQALHDSAQDVAASGSPGDAARTITNILAGLQDQAQGVAPDRAAQRREMYRLAASAMEKFAPHDPFNCWLWF